MTASQRQTADTRETLEGSKIAWTSSSSRNRIQRPQVPKEDNRGFLWEPGSTVLFWSATICDSFTVSVRAAVFLWEVTRTLISLISL